MQFKSFKTYMLVVCSSLVLLGCVSAEKYTKMVNGWIGADEDSLISTWGAPTSSYQTDQAKYLTYDNKQQNYIPPTPSSVQVIRQGDAVFTRPILVPQDIRTLPNVAPPLLFKINVSLMLMPRAILAFYRQATNLVELKNA